MCYKIKVIRERQRIGRIENERAGATFVCMCVLLLIEPVLFIDTTW